jgi:hypothetical protein
LPAGAMVLVMQAKETKAEVYSGIGERGEG